MRELLELINSLELDEIGAHEQFKEELERYEKFIGAIGQSNQPQSKHIIYLKSFAKYVLANGTKDEKREILKHLSGNLYLKDQRAYVERKRRPKKLAKFGHVPQPPNFNHSNKLLDEDSFPNCHRQFSPYRVRIPLKPSS